MPMLDANNATSTMSITVLPKYRPSTVSRMCTQLSLLGANAAPISTIMGSAIGTAISSVPISHQGEFVRVVSIRPALYRAAWVFDTAGTNPGEWPPQE